MNVGSVGILAFIYSTESKTVSMCVCVYEYFGVNEIVIAVE